MEYVYLYTTYICLYNMYILSVTSIHIPVLIGILMIEGLSDFLSEELMVEALRQGHEVGHQLFSVYICSCV